MNPVSLSFCVVAGSSPATFCRFVPERMDDFAWENDLVAFRAYGPAIAKTQGAENSGVDCWLKRVKYPIIDRWYLGKNYHMDTGEGNDPYHVGSSRGCGGTSIWKDGKMVTSGVFKEWKIISQSPEKSVFELSYQYALEDRVILEVKQITIEPGKRLFKSESTFTENGRPAKLDIAIGLTTHDSKASTTLNPERGWMSCWETIEGSGVGTGVVVDPLSRPKMFEISSGAKDQSHAVAVIPTDARGKTVHYAGYGWEKAGEIVSAEQWNRYLDRFWHSLTPAGTSEVPSGAQDRAYCVEVLTRIAHPVLSSLCEQKLKESLPIGKPDRQDYAPLEALGRTMAGIAPWLELGPDGSEEGKLRREFIQMAVMGIANAVDPQSPDYMNFKNGGQPLVDAAFLAHALLRAPKQIWGNLPEKDRDHLVAALKATRSIKPGMSNWLLFSAMVEAALWEFTGECRLEPIEFAVKKHLEWYQGDGTYGDGPDFHWDYYNSFVIQPMLLDVVKVCVSKKHPLGDQYDLLLNRAVRYAEVQERMISPEGTYPVIGRSSVYRFGAFQTLSQIALLGRLPSTVSPAAARSGTTEVIRRVIEAPGTFDDKGWLRPGAVGFQPSMADTYISTGSLYLCTVGMLQLGLPASDPFWTWPRQPWTQKKIWSGADSKGDHSIP